MNCDMFLEEWRLYRRGAERPRLAGERPSGDAAFDPCVRAGDVRIFADVNVPLVALVIEDRGLSGRRIVPVSPFHAPASVRELALGGRVYQLWNACSASRRFTDRSWLVDRVEESDVARIAAAVGSASPGRITAGDGPVAKYEREFLVSCGGFVPLVRPKARAVGFMPRLNAWGIAASIALLLGIGAAMSVWRGGIAGRGASGRGFCAIGDYDTIELVEAGDIAEERLAVTEPVVEFPLDADAPAFPNPVDFGCLWLSPASWRMAGSGVPLPRLKGSFHFGETYERIGAGEAMGSISGAYRAGPFRGGSAAADAGFAPGATNTPCRVHAPDLSLPGDDIPVDVDFQPGPLPGRK